MKSSLLWLAAFSLLNHSWAQAQTGPTDPEAGAPVAPVTSVYEISVVIDEEALEKNTRYQYLLENTNATKEDLLKQLNWEALLGLKLVLVAGNTIWTQANGHLFAPLTQETLEDVEGCFPKAAPMRPETKLHESKENIPTPAKAKITDLPETSEFQNLVGLTYKNAVEEVKNYYTRTNIFLACRLKSVDGYELANPYEKATDLDIIIFDVEGGKVVKVATKLDPKRNY